jgi:hypothetical protein
VNSAEFDQGLNVVLGALQVALNEAGVRGASANYVRSGSLPNDTIYSVNANGETQFITLSRQEIEDSAGGIDSPAAAKVRMIVSRFQGR